MKYIFVYPPTILNLSPIIEISQLIGILESQGIDSKIYDLNADFFTNVFNNKFFENYKTNYDIIYSEDFINNIPVEFRDKIVNSKYSKEDFQKHSEYYSRNIDFCNYILRSKKYIYNPILCQFSLNVISKAVIQIFQLEKLLLEGLLPGVSGYFSFSENDKRNINIDFLKYYINSDTNIYKEYIEGKVDEIMKQAPNCVGISINTNEQFFPGLTFAFFVKQKYPNTHINIGGAFFSTLYKKFTNIEELINVFCDTISIGSSDNTVVELMKYLNNKQSIENVPNILCLKNSKLFQTKKDTGMMLSEYPMPPFNGYKKTDYIVPEFILPVQASVSCYWGRCKFCACNRDRTYETKSVEKFVSEIEYLSKKYSTKYFYMWDNALHPKYMDKFADLLIKNKLSIKYSFYARFEEEFDIKLFKKLKKSGCVRINWGLDSASENMIELIDKGIDLSVAKNILKECYKSGISTAVSIIIGYPGEEKIDIEKNIEFFEQNKKYIDIVSIPNSMYFIEGSKFAERKYELQKMINTSFDERIKYINTIKQITNGKTRYWNYLASYNLLYASKYSRLFLEIIDMILRVYEKFKFISKYTIIFYMKAFKR